MHVPVDQATLDPAGNAQFVAAVDLADDFALDEDAGFAYLTRHRANTLDRVHCGRGTAARSGTSLAIRSIRCWPARPALSGAAAQATAAGWHT